MRIGRSLASFPFHASNGSRIWRRSEVGETATETEEDVESESVDEDEDEDEDDIVDVRNRRTQTRRRIVESDSESEEEDIPLSRFQNISLGKADSELDSDSHQVAEDPHTKSSQKANHSISNWAQEVVDLTSSPAGPSSTRMRTSSFASTTRPTSSYSVDGPGIVQ